MRRAYLLVGFVAGCLPEPSLSQVEQKAGCQDWYCGSNSPLIDNYGFHDVSLDKIPNKAGFVLEAFEKDGEPYKLSVEKGRLVAVGGSAILTGNDLSGAQMIFSLEGQKKYIVRIGEVGTTPYWAGETNDVVETYDFWWTTPELNEWQNVCPSPIDSTLGMEAFSSVVFEGERIDAEKKTIEDTLDNSWFNIGCAGSTLAKLYLTGHVQAASAADFETTIAQRQTMLKMFSADYCGTGKAYTVAGVKLDWKDDKEWMKHQHQVKLEARWSEKGATCLSYPRLEMNPTTLSMQTFPNGVEAEMLADGCKPEPCKNDDPEDLDGDHLVTGNPI